MKSTLSIVIGCLLVVTACNRDEPSRVGAAPEERASAETETQQRERELYVETLETKLDEYEHKFDGLDTRASEMTGTAKKDFTNTVQQLRDKSEGIALQLDNLKKASPDAWPQMKADIDSAFAMLEQSYQDLSKKYELAPATTSRS